MKITKSSLVQKLLLLHSGSVELLPLIQIGHLWLEQDHVLLLSVLMHDQVFMSLFGKKGFELHCLLHTKLDIHHNNVLDSFC